MKVNRVRITLEVDVEFIRLLQASVQLKGLTNEDLLPRMDPTDILSLIALGEMRGMLEEQIHLRTPPEWRPHIEAVHEERRWQSDGENVWHKSGGG